MPNTTAVKETLVQSSPGQQLLEKFGPLLRTGIDEAKRLTDSMPRQGSKFFAQSSESKGYKKSVTSVGAGVMRQGRDNAELHNIETYMGFENELTTVTYNASMSVEQELLEREQYGIIRNRQTELMNAAKLTEEILAADVFNRGFGGASATTADPYNAAGAAPFVCPDGAYLISTKRNRAMPGVADWANRMTDVAFTASGNNEAALAQIIKDIKLQARQYISANGILSPKMVKRFIISPVLEDLFKRVTGTTMVYAGGDSSGLTNKAFSDQAVNTIASTKYEVYDWLSDGLIYAELEGTNNLEMLWRVKPSTVTYTDGRPYMLNQAVRMSLGFGCAFDPDTWIGIQTTGTDNV